MCVGVSVGVCVGVCVSVCVAGEGGEGQSSGCRSQCGFDVE